MAGVESHNKCLARNVNTAAQALEDHPGMLQSAYNTVSTQIKHIHAPLGVDTRTRFLKLLLGWFGKVKGA